MKDGLRSSCKECVNAANVAYRADNPDKVKAAAAAYRADNPDKVKASAAAWRAANPDKVKAKSAACYAANPDKAKAWQAAYRAGGRDPNRPWPEGYVGYPGAHRRVEATYGPAGNYDCLHCGGSAAEWAYDYGDPDEFSAPRRDARKGSVRVMHWSGKPKHYMPLCQGCHNTHDKTMTKGRDQ